MILVPLSLLVTQLYVRISVKTLFEITKVQFLFCGHGGSKNLLYKAHLGYRFTVSDQLYADRRYTLENPASFLKAFFRLYSVNPLSLFRYCQPSAVSKVVTQYYF